MLTVPSPTPFVHPIAVRYLEVDHQGVVFNMWYLAYLDDAMTAFLLHGGLPYADMIARGFDVQLVHSEIDWKGSLTFSSSAEVAVTLARLGRTSFTLQIRGAILRPASGHSQHGVRVGSDRRIGKVRSSDLRGRRLGIGGPVLGVTWTGPG